MRIFHTKVFFGSFFLVTFWQISTFVLKNAQKMLMKLTPVYMIVGACHNPTKNSQLKYYDDEKDKDI